MQTPPASEPFAIAYDLQDPQAWLRAHRDRRLWERRYTDYHVLDHDRILLVFRPAPDTRWRGWEQVRRGWILEGAA